MQCRPPTEGLFIEVKVAGDTATVVWCVWEELSPHGTADMPEFQALDMAAALRVASTYESFLVFVPAPWGTLRFSLRCPSRFSGWCRRRCWMASRCRRSSI
ncbi:hypothetical protein TraAM80_05666 [Trypanosoma rangeli]|uniref:Uncharacterized protein n=1 Tax=Trypanosoma rangeli TaxID=5698 RepID=A0A3R7K8V9_TRYRA|nr:uncharacterized protein TraAM80_05666 [Trypanosoma rangeli]RNF03624.1 hypothetical protein TraAM80_05666 [Trypanosoma rangeli]|eukprot:RNF03624.1 hypothetical protein TraAM80_05666 [Trypanosoma rangeli]